jgi:serine/threonine protein kinase
MEFAERGSLFDYVQMNRPFPEGHALRYFAKLISALEYLHRTSYVPHHNPKPENVF